MIDVGGNREISSFLWVRHVIVVLPLFYFFFIAVVTMQERYASELRKGLPWPILATAEYFSADQGGLRWMRHFHDAGHFAFIMLWYPNHPLALRLEFCDVKVAVMLWCCLTGAHLSCGLSETFSLVSSYHVALSLSRARA